jgi:hypothetical protein
VTSGPPPPAAAATGPELGGARRSQSWMLALSSEPATAMTAEEEAHTCCFIMCGGREREIDRERERERER